MTESGSGISRVGRRGDHATGHVVGCIRARFGLRRGLKSALLQRRETTTAEKPINTIVASASRSRTAESTRSAGACVTPLILQCLSLRSVDGVGVPAFDPRPYYESAYTCITDRRISLPHRTRGAFTNGRRC